MHWAYRLAIAASVPYQRTVTCHENEKYPQNIVPNIETFLIFA